MRQLTRATGAKPPFEKGGQPLKAAGGFSPPGNSAFAAVFAPRKPNPARSGQRQLLIGYLYKPIHAAFFQICFRFPREKILK
jgi:hypothetical protein